MGVTAEGIETPGRIRLMSIAGRNGLQGYLLSRPLVVGSGIGSKPAVVRSGASPDAPRSSGAG